MLEFDTPLQADMFTGTLVDTRTSKQKQADSARQRNLTQLEMFSQREVAQFGVRANPVMPLSPGRLVLVQEDPRSDEEIEQDRFREAERLTTPLPLAETSEPLEPALQDWDIPVLWTSRADMIKRRPDLTPAIQELRDYEIEALAALLGEALQEFYWIQLNVILALNLDHDLQLLKRVKRNT